MQIFDLLGTLTIEGVDQAGSKLQSLGFSIENIGNNITNFGNRLYDSVTKPIMGIVEKSVMLASDLTEVQNVVDVTFGEQGKAVTQWAGTLLEKYGMVKLESMQYVGSMGAMLQASGLSTKSSQDMSEKLVQLTGDMSSFYNLKHDEVWEKIRAGISGEVMPLKSLGINMSVANLEAYALSKGINTSWKEMSQAEQTTLRYEYLMDKTSKTQGDFARTSETFANKLRVVEGKLSDLGASIGAILIPYLTQGASFVEKLIDKFRGLDENAKKIILVVSLIVASIAPVIIVFGTLITIVGTVISSFGVIASVFASIGIVIPVIVTAVTAIIVIFGGLMLSSESVRKKLHETFDSAVAKIKEAATFIKKHIGDIKDAVLGLIEALKSGNWTQFKEAIQNMFPNHTKQITDWIDKFESFKTKVIEIRDKIIEFSKKVIEFVTPLAKMFKDTFEKLDTKKAVEAFDNFKQSINAAMPVIKTVAAVLGGVLATAIAVVIGYFNGVVAALPSVIGFFTSVWGIIINFFAIVVGTFTGNGELVKANVLALWENIKSLFSNGINAVVKFVSGFVNGIVTFFTSLYDTLVGHSIIPDMINSILDWFRNLWSTGVNIVTNFINSVINFFKNLLSQAQSIFNSVYSAITSILSNVLNTGSNLVNSLVNTIRNVLSALYGIASDAFNGVVNAISNKVGSAASAASSVANGIKNAITGIAGSMYNAGANIIQSVIDGIGSMIGKVKNAAGNVAQAIKNFFPSSPAKEGALQSIPQWMPTMIDMITKDLETGVDKVKLATNKVTNAINPTSDLKLNSTTLTNPNKVENKVSDIVNHIALTVYKDADINKVMKEFNKIIKGEVVVRGGVS